MVLFSPNKRIISSSAKDHNPLALSSWQKQTSLHVLQPCFIMRTSRQLFFRVNYFESHSLTFGCESQSVGMLYNHNTRYKFCILNVKYNDGGFTHLLGKLFVVFGKYLKQCQVNIIKSNVEFKSHLLCQVCSLCKTCMQPVGFLSFVSSPGVQLPPTLKRR